jgi:hypothetical protein
VGKQGGQQVSESKGVHGAAGTVAAAAPTMVATAAATATAGAAVLVVPMTVPSTFIYPFHSPLSILFTLFHFNCNYYH